MFSLLVSLCSILSLADTGKVVYQQDFQSGNSDILFPATPAPGVKNGTAVVTTEGTNKFLKFTTHTGTDVNGYFNANFGPAVKDFDLEFKLKPDILIIIIILAISIIGGVSTTFVYEKKKSNKIKFKA